MNMIKRTRLTSMDLIVKLMLPAINSGKSAKFTVVGDSMLPLFVNGRDNVIMKKPDKIRITDVILYQRSNGDYVLHRVVGKTKEGYKLCGDNQLVIEQPVYRDSVIAVMTAFERKGVNHNTNCLWYMLYSVIWSRLIFARRLMLKTVLLLKKLSERGKKGEDKKSDA